MPITVDINTRENQEASVRTVLFKVYFDWKKDNFKAGLKNTSDWVKCKQYGFPYIEVDSISPESLLTISSDVEDDQTNIATPNDDMFGNGIVLDVKYTLTSQGEIIKLIFLDYIEQADGTRNSRWAVYGMGDLKTMEDALSEAPYTNGLISFFIQEGSIEFREGDIFTIYPSLSTKNPNDSATLKNVSVEGDKGLVEPQEFFVIHGGPDFLSWESIHFLTEGNVIVEARSYTYKNDSFVDDYVIYQDGDDIAGHLTKEKLDLKITLISSGGNYAKIAYLYLVYKVKSHTNNTEDETYYKGFQDIIGIRTTRSRRDLIQGYSSADLDLTLNNAEAKYSYENVYSSYKPYLRLNVPVYVELGFNEQTIPKIKAFVTHSSLNTKNKTITFRGQDLSKKLLKKQIVKGDLGYRNWTNKTVHYLIKVLSIDGKLEDGDLDLFDTTSNGLIEFASFKGKNIWKALQEIAGSILAEIFISQEGKLKIQDVSRINNKIKSPRFGAELETWKIEKNFTSGDMFFVFSSEENIENYILIGSSGAFISFATNFLSFVEAVSDKENNYNCIWGIKPDSIYRLPGDSLTAPSQQEHAVVSFGELTNVLLYDLGEGGDTFESKTAQRLIGILYDEPDNQYSPYYYNLYSVAGKLNSSDIHKQIQEYEYNISEGSFIEIVLDRDLDELAERGMARNTASIQIFKNTQYVKNKLLRHDSALSGDETWRFKDGSSNTILQIRNVDEFVSDITYRIFYIPAHPVRYLVNREFEFSVIHDGAVKTDTISIEINTLTYTVGDIDLSPNISIGNSQAGDSIENTVLNIIDAINSDSNLSEDILAYRGDYSIVKIRLIKADNSTNFDVTLSGDTDYDLLLDNSVLPINSSDISRFVLEREFITDVNKTLGKLVVIDRTNETRYRLGKHYNSSDEALGRSYTYGNIFYINYDDTAGTENFYIQNMTSPNNDDGDSEKKYFPDLSASGREITKVVGIECDYNDGVFVIIAETKRTGIGVPEERLFLILKYYLIDPESEESIVIPSRVIETGPILEFITVDGDNDYNLIFNDITFNEKDLKIYISAGYPQHDARQGRLYSYKDQSYVTSAFTNLVGKPLKRAVVRNSKSTTLYKEKEYQLYFQKRGGFLATTAQIWSWFSYNRQNEDKTKCAIVQETRQIERSTGDPLHKFEVPHDFADYQYIFVDGLEVGYPVVFDQSDFKDFIPASGGNLEVQGKAGDLVFEEAIPIVSPVDTVVTLGKGRILKKYYGKFLEGNQSILGNDWSDLSSLHSYPYKPVQIQVTVKNAKSGTLFQEFTGEAGDYTVNLTDGVYVVGSGELHVFVDGDRISEGTETLEYEEIAEDEILIYGLTGGENIICANRVVTINGYLLGAEETSNEYFAFTDQAESSDGEVIRNSIEVIFGKGAFGIQTINAETVRDSISTGATELTVESVFDDIIEGIDIEVFKSTQDDDKEQFGGDGTVSSLVQSASINIKINNSLTEIANITNTESISALFTDKISGYIYCGLGFNGRTVIYTPDAYEYLIPDFIFSYDKNIETLTYSYDDTRIKNNVIVKANRREILPVQEFDLRGRLVSSLVPERLRVWEELYEIWKSQSPYFTGPGDFHDFDLSFSEPIDNNGLNTNIRFNAQFVQTISQLADVERESFDDSIIFNPVTDFDDGGEANDGFMTVTSNGHSFSDGQTVRIYESNNYNGDYEVIATTANTFTIISRDYGSDNGKAALVIKAFDSPDNVIDLFTGNAASGGSMKIGTAASFKPRLILSEPGVLDASMKYDDGTFINSNSKYYSEGVPDIINRDSYPADAMTIVAAERANVEVYASGELVRLNRATDSDIDTDYDFDVGSISYITGSGEIDKIYRMCTINPATNIKGWRPIFNFIGTKETFDDLTGLSPSDGDLACITNISGATEPENNGELYQYIDYVDYTGWIKVDYWHNKIPVNFANMDAFQSTYAPGGTSIGKTTDDNLATFPTTGQNGDMVILAWNRFNIVAATGSSNRFKVKGDHREVFKNGVELRMRSSSRPDDDTIYTVNGDSTFGTSNTFIIVSPGFSNETLTDSELLVLDSLPLEYKRYYRYYYVAEGPLAENQWQLIREFEDQVIDYETLEDNIPTGNDADGKCRYAVIQDTCYRWTVDLNKWVNISTKFIRPSDSTLESGTGLPSPTKTNDYIFDSNGNISITETGRDRIHRAGSTDLKTLSIYYPNRVDAVRRDIDKNTTQIYNGETADGNIKKLRKLFSYDLFGFEYGVLIGGFHLGMIFPNDTNLSETAYLRIENSPNDQLDAHYSIEDPGIVAEFSPPFTDHELGTFINKIEVRGLPIVESPVELTSLTDQNSIKEFGENAHNLQNDYIQNVELAKILARRTLSRYADINPELKKTIPGNVEIELADVVSIKEINSRMSGDLTTITSISDTVNVGQAYKNSVTLEKLKDIKLDPVLGENSLIAGGIVGQSTLFSKETPPTLKILQAFLFPSYTESETVFKNIPGNKINREITYATEAPGTIAKFYHTIENSTGALETSMVSELSPPSKDLIPDLQTYDGGSYSPINEQKYSLTGYYESMFLTRDADTNGWLKLIWSKSNVTLIDGLPNVMIQYRVSNTFGAGSWSVLNSGIDQELTIQEGGSAGSKKRYFQFRIVWFTKKWDPELLATIKNVAVLII